VLNENVPQEVTTLAVPIIQKMAQAHQNVDFFHMLTYVDPVKSPTGSASPLSIARPASPTSPPRSSRSSGGPPWRPATERRTDGLADRHLVA
jgi:hypothetical protein